MKTKKYLLFLASIFLLGGCDFSYNPSKPLQPEEPTVPTEEPSSKEEENTDKPPVPTEEEEEEDKPITPPISDEEEDKEPVYVEWPVEDMTYVIMGIDKNATETVPAFNKATEIEIDWQLYLDEGYFGIYCKTEDANSENEYKNILKDAGWEVLDKRNESQMYDAFSPMSQLWINFVYNTQYKELEIFVTKGIIIHWPAEKIAEYVALLVSDTLSVIPSIDATSYIVNYYPQYLRVAINIYGLLKESIQQYVEILTNNNWNVVESAREGEYEAISPDEKIELDIYYDLEKSELNIDVAKHYPTPTSWPLESINQILSELGVSGSVLPYYETATSFATEYDWSYPIIIVYLARGTELAAAEAYNQSLLDEGYLLVGTLYGDPVYNLPGTTLYYRAVYLTEGCITIELFNEEFFIQQGVPNEK